MGLISKFIDNGKNTAKIAFEAAMDRANMVADFVVKSFSISDFDRVQNSSDTFSESQRMDANSTFYGTLPWVGVAVNRVISDCKNRELYATRISSTKRVDVDIPDDLRSILFENQSLSFDEIMTTVIGNLLLTGNAFILKRKGSIYGKVKNRTDSIVPIPSRWVSINYATDGSFQIRNYTINGFMGVTMAVDPVEMIHIRMNNIFNPLVGMGNTAPMTTTGSASKSRAELAQYYAKNKGQLGMIIKLKPENSLDDAEFMRTTKLISTQIDGRENAGKTKMITCDDIIFPEFSFSDMQYVEMQNYEKELSAASIGVPLSVLGVPASNYATAKVERDAYLTGTCNQILVLIAKALNKGLVREIDKRIELNFDLYKSGDVDEVIKMLDAGIITYNRAAEILGQSVVDGSTERDRYKTDKNINQNNQ